MLQTDLSVKDPAGQIHFKLENFQPTGSFKIRGATNKILRLREADPQTGIIAVSTGNHGKAVAYAASMTGFQALICLSESADQGKVQAIRRIGGEIEQFGSSYDEAAKHAARLAEERSLTMIHPFDDLEIIEGQGTIGLELLEDLPQIGQAVVPLSGGGLISGIGSVLKWADPSIKVIGVSMEAGAVMQASLRAGRPVELPEEKTLADALVGGLGEENQFTFHLCQKVVDRTLLVSESEIEEAIWYMADRHHLIVEGGGAVGIAAWRSGKLPLVDRPTAIVVSGGNIDNSVFAGIVQRKFGKGEGTPGS